MVPRLERVLRDGLEFGKSTVSTCVLLVTDFAGHHDPRVPPVYPPGTIHAQNTKIQTLDFQSNMRKVSENISGGGEREKTNILRTHKRGN